MTELARNNFITDSNSYNSTPIEALPLILEKLLSEISSAEKVSGFYKDLTKNINLTSDTRPEQVTKPYFISNLISAIMEEPVEDGYFHPAEEIIRKAISENKKDFSRWIMWLVDKESNSSLIADIVRCIGRFAVNELGVWSMELARTSLKHTNVEVRDAAVQALELWESPAAVDLLKEHDESTPWLKEYIERIIKEMS